MEEQVMVVDAGNRPLGAVSRSRMRARNLRHRAVYILVFNSEGALFTHQRTFTKDLYPGYFDVAAGGVVLAEETWEAAAVRELHEELGIRDVALEFLFDCYFEDPQSRVFGRVYRCIFDGTLNFQAEEILDGAFLPLPDILRNSDARKYTPDGWAILNRYSEQGYSKASPIKAAEAPGG